MSYVKCSNLMKNVNKIFEIDTRYFMKYLYDILSGSVPEGTTANLPNDSITTNHNGNIDNTINHGGNSANHGVRVEPALKGNTIPILSAIPLLIGSMLPPGGGGNGRGHNRVRQETSHRTPPRWGPEMEPKYSFKTYIVDPQLWSTMTDLAPYQQFAAVIPRLSGAAEDLARTHPPAEKINGGLTDGVQLDPLSYLRSRRITRKVRFARGRNTPPSHDGII